MMKMNKLARPSAEQNVELLKYEPLENFLSSRPTFGTLTYGPVLNPIGEHSDSEQADDETECEEELEAIFNQQVCHHSDCQDHNAHRPLMLCTECDTEIHSQAENAGHLRFDIMRKGSTGLMRNTSTRSLPGTMTSPNKLPSEDEDEEDNTEKADEIKDGGDSPDAVFYSENSPTRLKPRLLRGEENARPPPLPPTPIPSTNGHHARSASVPIERTIPVPERRRRDYRATSPLSSSPLTHDEFSPPEDTTDLGISMATSPVRENGLLGRASPSPHPKDSDSNSFNSDITRNQSFSSESSDDRIKPPELESYTPEELKYTRLKRVSTSSPVLRNPRNIVNKRLHVDGHMTASRKISMPAWHASHHTHSLDSDERTRKYSLGTEYFTVKFELGGTTQDIEIVAAQKGKSLKEAVRPCLEKRGINSSNINIFIASSNTPLPVEVDCFPLGGNHLHVKAKEGESAFQRSGTGSGTFNKSVSLSNIPAKLKQSSKDRDKNKDKLGGSQRDKRKLPAPDDASYSDTSPHGTLTNNDVQKIQGSRRAGAKISNIFSPIFNKNKFEELQDHLSRYDNVGLPGMPELVKIGRPQYEEEIFKIEEHWTKVVSEEVVQSLNKKEKDQQERTWEIISTEVEYIRRLKVIRDLFFCCLMDLQNHALLNEIETDKVFSNICDVYDTNCQFWDEHMSLIVIDARQTQGVLNPSHMKGGFEKFEEIFTAYTKFCLEQEACQDYIKKKCAENELFKHFVSWAEHQPECNRLKLTDLMVTPMHRITRYKLLLKAILKSTDDEQQRKELIFMIEQVEHFVDQVNTVMNQQQAQIRLKQIIERIEGYDAIDLPTDEATKVMGEFMKLDLTCPVPGCGPQQRRHLLREGSLKLKDGKDRTEVYCFLFTDMLLVTKVKDKRGDKVKVTKPPMRLDHIVVHHLRDGASFILVYLNEYHLASAFYTLSGDSKVWVDHIKKAQESYKKMREAAMQRPEQRLMYLNICDEDEEGYSADLRSDYSPDHTYIRLDSTGSVENFIGILNSNISRSTSQDTLVRMTLTDMDRPNLLSSISIDEGERLGFKQGRRPRSATFEPNGGRRSPHPPLRVHKSASEYEETDSQFLVPGIPGSSPGSGRVTPDMDQMQQRLENYSSVARVIPGHTYIRTDSGSSDGSYHHQVAGSDHKLNARGGDLPLDENLRSKLNQRRCSRTEKRWHTADAIQEMQRKDRDSSIHKRLSWNLGTVDINIDERHSVLKNKTFSSDSLRSMPSSSGVSSTGSLHLSPESEINEECESKSASVSSVRYSHSLDYSPGHTPHEIHAQTESIAEHDTEKDLDENSQTQLSPQDKMFSKSMPNISNLNVSLGDIQDGIASVQIPTPDGSKRKVTHSELLRMKKLLLNSTLEASEV